MLIRTHAHSRRAHRRQALGPHRRHTSRDARPPRVGPRGQAPRDARARLHARPALDPVLGPRHAVRRRRPGGRRAQPRVSVL